jgi:hypothetical protein
LLGLGGLNELLVNSNSHLLFGHISRKFSPSISNFEIIGSLFTFINSRIKSESPKTEFIDIIKKLLKPESQDISLFSLKKI